MNNLPQLPLIDGALLIDNSTIEKLRCPKMLEYSWLRKRSLVASKAGRNFGSCLHIGWASRYEHVGAGPVTQDAIADQHEKMAAWMQESPPPEGDFRNFNHSVTMMNAYNEHYRQESFTILTAPKTGKPIIECSFMLPFGTIFNTPVFYTGKIDLGVCDPDGIYGPQNGIWSFDHKTAFQFGDSFIRQMQEDGGQRGYCWALGKIFGRKPEGYIIDAVRVRRPTKKDEYAGISPVDATDFQRLPFPLSQAQIDEWERDTKELIFQIFDMHGRNYFPRHRWNCVGKYGPCDFIEVCSAGEQFREQILFSSLFEENNWSPLNKANASSD